MHSDVISSKKALTFVQTLGCFLSGKMMENEISSRLLRIGLVSPFRDWDNLEIGAGFVGQ